MARILRLSEENTPRIAERCAEVLAAGGLVILPTDTVYGLAAKADLPGAVGKIFAIKGREAYKALVVMVPDRFKAAELAAPGERDALLRLGRLWPGPLTLVVKAGDVGWRANVAPASETLGVRVPRGEFLLNVLRLSGPIAVTSANLSGRDATASFCDIQEEMLAGVELAVDGGKRGSGRPSTVAEIKNGDFEILREGKIGERELRRALDMEHEAE